MRGKTLAAQKDDEIDTAIRDYRHALSLDPDIKSAHQYLECSVF